MNRVIAALHQVDVEKAGLASYGKPGNYFERQIKRWSQQYLASVTEPLSDAQMMAHRAVAVADSAQRASPLTVNLLPGQDVFTVPTMAAKIEALLRCLGCGFVPEPQVRAHLRTGRLVAKAVQRCRLPAQFGYAWRGTATPQPRKAPQGLALQWWLTQLDSPTTRQALLERHDGFLAPLD